jgi:DNA-directed RNA polymerase subunit RPC12/RpoP
MDMFENPNYYFVERTYKSKYICTDCRKVFKRRELSDITTKEGDEVKESKCPECGQRTSWIGPKFRAPKKDSIEAWNSIKTLNNIGVLNFIGFAHDKMIIPESKKSLHDLLLVMKHNYHLTIKQWMTMEYSPDNNIQIQYFSEAIKRIDQYLKENK